MINVGIVGIGFMGWIHWLAYQRSKRMNVAAIQTRSAQKREGDWTGIQGNFGPPGQVVDLSDVKAYSEYSQLLADPSIDIVDICLPPHLHVEAIEQAFAAGKHVFCEKPLTVTTEEADHLVRIACEAKKQLLVGQVLPFFPEYAYARKVIDSGNYGRVIGGSFKRVISDPLWLPDFYDPVKTGGPLIDLHVHDAHFIRMIFGMPEALISAGRTRGEVVEYCNTIFEFSDAAISVSATCGVINQQGRPFTHGFEIHLENASLQFEFAGFTDVPETMPLKVLGPDGKIERPDLGDGDPLRAFCDEIDEVARAIESGRPSEILSGELAKDAILLCHKQTESVKTGKLIRL